MFINRYCAVALALKQEKGCSISAATWGDEKSTWSLRSSTCIYPGHQWNDAPVHWSDLSSVVYWRLSRGNLAIWVQLQWRRKNILIMKAIWVICAYESHIVLLVWSWVSRPGGKKRDIQQGVVGGLLFQEPCRPSRVSFGRALKL